MAKVIVFVVKPFFKFIVVAWTYLQTLTCVFWYKYQCHFHTTRSLDVICAL